MNPVHITAFGITPLLMCLSYHHKQHNYKETGLFKTESGININKYINPMRKASETGVKTRIFGPRLLGRDYSYRGEKAWQFFETLRYTTLNIFSRFANV